jgi:thioredoxin-related protein
MKLKHIILLLVTSAIHAQNRHINFETGNLASVLEKATKENKLIFIDAYTTWCGPCKQMDKRVFTNDSVADHFNSKFVNYRLDMEKGEGIEFAKKYEVNCYPNLIILDGKGTLVHRSAGFLETPVFLSFARTAQTPGKTFVEQKNELLKKGLDEKSIHKYIELLSSACFEPTTEVSEYIAKVNENDLVKKGNWELVRDYVNNYDSREIKYVMANQSKFESAFGKEEVANKFASLGSEYFMPYTKEKEINLAAYEKAKQEFKARNFPQSDRVIFNADLRVFGRTDKPAYYALAAKDFLKYNSNDANALNSMAWKFYEDVSDPAQLRSAVEMSKQATELVPNYMFLDTYAAVLFKSGNYSEANKIAAEAIEKAKKEKLSEEDYKETVELQKKIKAKLNSKQKQP